MNLPIEILQNILSYNTDKNVLSALSYIKNKDYSIERRICIEKCASIARSNKKYLKFKWFIWDSPSYTRALKIREDSRRICLFSIVHLFN